MKKIFSLVLVMSVVLCLFASCGSSNKIAGRWAADNLDSKTLEIYFFDMNLSEDGTGDYHNGSHYSDGRGISGKTRPLTWTQEKNIITCTLETNNGDEVIKFEYTKNNAEQDGVDTLKFLNGDYEGKYLTPAESGTDTEDIFDLPEKTTKEHNEVPQDISIDALLQMGYSEYTDKDFYFYIEVTESSMYMANANVYGNPDFTGTYFKDTSIVYSALKNAPVGSKYKISASVIHCNEEGLSLSVFDAVPIS